ncbi:Succinylglutamate desuccinylase / Aspartoacylase family protein (plasmid) [Caballeronia sp. SBC1]|uniref:succinylglutamate desuccinylase/aspartoacylase family protein n=1 Tax=unclassified Caballeronia TaxID=2646786 RepID=UPI0013E0EDBF|nr:MULTISPECIES: succinylglutamate desuccinylase/aspartoacylase family protein [unclassified Caballeronia]QIE28047.1 Succinylglutamate desuccinylase / Aspartoacylase family protein [Caballeronia sp. SBC2]QIN66111.1 Succinylglutamate desuccinylase / Aspartoacylase family protein [Caballeronia sp. SBC1]
MTLSTEYSELPALSPGASHRLLKHTFEGVGSIGSGLSAYIQAGLHADELPGMLVIQHLLEALVKLDNAGRIRGRIVVRPFANPIGLGQRVFGAHTGRFNLDNGENFNRRFPDLTCRVETALATRDIAHNDVKSAKALFADVAAELTPLDPVAAMKAALLTEALQHDIVLDLHCDTDGILHLYSSRSQHTQAVALARCMGIKAVFLEDRAGGTPFDEAVTQCWSVLQQAGVVDEEHAAFCTSVELRGQADVSDAFAHADAQGILHYLALRGLVDLDPDNDHHSHPLAEQDVMVFPLEGVSHVPAPVGGLVAYKKRPGDTVRTGELIAEIIPLLGAPGAARHPVFSDVDGLLIVQQYMKLVRPGQRVALLAGKEALPHRKTGQLLNDF